MSIFYAFSLCYNHDIHSVYLRKVFFLELSELYDFYVIDIIIVQNLIIRLTKYRIFITPKSTPFFMRINRTLKND